jgi:hypothetical protein
MTLRWAKRHLVFTPPGDVPFVASHAALPVVDAGGNGDRVYWSGRDGQGRARIAFFETDLMNPGRGLRVSTRPVLDLGPLGAFDDSGVTSSCLVNHGNRKYLYYTGWSLGVTVPFYLFIGLAISEDGGETFQRASPAPVPPRSAADPYLTASPWVLVEEGRWRMWYVSGTGWKAGVRRAEHSYHIQYAESADGIHWRSDGRVCITYAAPGEHAFARPCVVPGRDGYRMWYSYRGDRYRIGYAESRDGLEWERRDAEAGIEASDSGWDSEMVCYPFVFLRFGREVMLYNGNDYGRTGIGMAVAER